MATNALLLYSNPECTQLTAAWKVGAVAFFGQLTYLYNWGQLNGGIYWAGTIPTGQAVFSGGETIYNFGVSQNLPFSDEEENADTLTENPQTVKINHRLFLGRDNENQISRLVSIECTRQDVPYPQYYATVLTYTQNPWNSTRQTWLYNRIMEWISYPPPISDNYNCFKVFRGVIENKEYYFLTFNIAADNTFSSNIFIIGLPREWFDGSIPETWTGQETESNSENAYTPTAPYRGSVLPRDLTNKRNPYGFNSGNGLTLAVITFEEYAAILQGIYAGSAESVLNKLSQGWATIVGGNTHRPADEVQAITNAILACHMIPQLTGYVSGSMTLRTIAGYHILGGNASESVTLSLWTTQNTIFEFETSTYYIQRRLNSFLDFEPYTTIILHLPFMPTVDIKPSILYGNGLKIHYKIDIFTGVLSADIMIVDNGSTSQDTPREFILTTLQTNVKTDIPIMGNGAQSGMFSSLTNALVSSVGAESYSGLIAGGIGAADMFSKMSTGQAVGQSKIDGIGAYLSNRQPYLIITRPNPANPPNYNQLTGIPSHMGGKVGDYFRSNNSQNLQYTEFAAVDLSGIAATEQEKTEIENLLKSGVFI